MIAANTKVGPALNTLLHFDLDGSLDVIMSRVEIGQGIQTAIAQIVAEELDFPIDRICVTAPDTALVAEGGYTAGSNSIQGLGEQMHAAAADARQLALLAAADRFGLSPDELTVAAGVISGAGGAGASYGELLNEELMQSSVSGIGTRKSPEQYSIIGRSVPRGDLAEGVTGARRFLHDLTHPGMLHGRVVRPPSYSARLVSAQTEGIAALPGVVEVVRRGSFLGVIAQREEQAVAAAEALRVVAKWHTDVPLVPQSELFTRLMDTPDEARLIMKGAPVEGEVPPIKIPLSATATLEATYTRPYQMHASLAPSAAMALVAEAAATGPRLTVWTHSQGVHPLRDALAQVLELPVDEIRVRHVEGAGCYGHNGADDAGLDASLLALATPGRPVLLKWSRQDEHAWEPYGSCALVQMQGSLDASGTIVDWNHDVYSHTHGGRPRHAEGSSGLLAAWHLDPPIPAPTPRLGGGSHGGIHRNAEPLYRFQRKRVVKHFVPDSPLRVSALRGLGAYANVFAIESFMDELALAAGADPVAFRLRHLPDDRRAREVIEVAARGAGWTAGVREGGAGEGTGQGIGFARYKNEKAYVAVVAEVEVDRNTGRISLRRLVIGGDVGQIVNPDGVKSQLEGGAVQSASWTLKEAVTFGPDGITSVDWDSYPVLGFEEAPEVETILLDRPGEPSLGCGEATQGPVPAAIGNALFHAVGIRFRDIPFGTHAVADRRHASESLPKGS